MQRKKLPVPLLVDKEDFIPTYATSGSAGADLRASLDDDIVLLPGESVLIPTGIYIEIPEGYEAQVRPRSGLALKHQITVLNSPGTIDSDYRGQLQVILMNLGKKEFIISPKMRIAQLVIAPVLQAEFFQKISLTTTKRSEDGFGHSGTH